MFTHAIMALLQVQVPGVPEHRIQDIFKPLGGADPTFSVRVFDGDTPLVFSGPAVGGGGVEDAPEPQIEAPRDAIVKVELAVWQLELEYVSCADPLTLAELDGTVERAVLSLAVRVGKARLIDNALLGIRLQDLDKLQ